MISRGSGKNEFPINACPFSLGDRAEYEIWGEWQGKDRALNHGNNTGLQKFITLNRTQSHILIYETKSEKIRGIFEGMLKTWLVEASSYWIYDVTSRNLEGTDSYAWLWIRATDIGKENPRIEIFDLIFQITGTKEFFYFGQMRSAWVATYNKFLDDPINALHVISYEFWFDIKTGLMLYYVVRLNAFDLQGRLVEWSYYSTRLNFTTVNLNSSYLFNEKNGISENTPTILLYPVSIITCSLILIFIRLIRKGKDSM